MNSDPVSEIRIRELDPSSHEEIRLVAERMRLTLVEVLGEEVFYPSTIPRSSALLLVGPVVEG